jgi:hypothetical protein
VNISTDRTTVTANTAVTTGAGKIDSLNAGAVIANNVGFQSYTGSGTIVNNL